MRIRAVVCDIDGTITDSRKLIQSQGIEALRAVQESGVDVMIASGNVLPISYAISAFIGCRGPVIAENGGIVSFGEDVYKLNDIAMSERAYEYLRSRMDAPRLFTDRWRETEVALKRTLDPTEVGEALKGCGVKIETTGFAIHIMQPDHSKFRGIQRAAEILGIDTIEVAAFGDSDNDEAMLRGCGFGVAVGNASPAAKGAADYVAKAHHSDGVIEGLRHLGLLDGND
jgi:phosphoglycolate phosphatase (TIGR01487 family)